MRAGGDGGGAFLVKTMGNVFRRAVQMCCTDRLCRWKIRARRQRIRAEPPVMTALSSARCNEQIQGFLRCPPPSPGCHAARRTRQELLDCYCFIICSALEFLRDQTMDRTTLRYSFCLWARLTDTRSK